MRDLFNGSAYKPIDDSFRWMVSIFSSGGAAQVIQKANDVQLRTYYPLRINRKGELVPLWTNYLIIEFREYITIELCRSASKFIKVISAHDDEGILRPMLVRKNAIDENMRMITQGKFDDIQHKRRFYGRGSLVVVLDGAMLDRKIRLEEDITPNMIGSRKVAISIGDWKGKIEIFRLNLI